MKSFRVKAIIALCLAFSVSVFVLPSAAQGFSGSGDGTPESPYLISSCDELEEVALDLSGSYELTTDLDCSANGNDVAYPLQNDFFEGTFDGANHTLTIEKDTGPGDYSGLFRRLLNATVTDLTLNGTVAGSWDTGGLAGYAENTTITNVVSNVDVTGGRYVGGLVGLVSDTTVIQDSSATGTVTGSDSFVGGLVGYGNGEILDSFATGVVSSDGSSTGGLIGYAQGGSNIERSYATGYVEAQGDNVGGFVGYNGGEIDQSYATGNVNGNGDVGGFVGEEGGATYDSYARGNVEAFDYAGGFVGYRDCGDNYRSYSTGEVSSQNPPSGGFIGLDDCGDAVDLFWDTETSGISESDIGTGKTTAEMKDVATFTDTATDGLGSAWDFTGTQNDDAGTDDIWAIDGTTNDGYPYFGWAAPAEEEPAVTSATTTSTPTGKAVKLEWNSSCDLTAFEVKAESVNTTQDIAFEYPNGLANFTLSSCVGDSVTITLTYFNVDNASFVLRKYVASSGAYSTVTAATLNATTVDGTPAIQATYTIQDNGPLDSNPATGVISDPAGIAKAVIAAPRTGGGGTAN